jgi:acetyl-CoA C-acetyltransferase
VVDPRTPCLIGVAQRTWRPDEDSPEPLDMWEHVARQGAEDVGRTALLRELDSLRVMYCMSWPYDDPPAGVTVLRATKTMVSTPRYDARS